jgi:hypothetical protein
LVYPAHAHTDSSSLAEYDYLIPGEGADSHVLYTKVYPNIPIGILVIADILPIF